MIKRLFPDKVYNPIRKHIQMSFDFVGDTFEMAEKIAFDLRENAFDPEKSRVLIFGHTRKGTEDAVGGLNSALESLKLPYAGMVDFYHAGLDGSTREEKYKDYKDGKIVILIATKAFGMGMDIKNIHFIFHLGPSSTFEDYLQEVGRAGRDRQMLLAAGYSDSNPLHSKCLVTREDFKKVKDRFHKNQITWNQIDQVRLSIFEYYSKFRKLERDLEKAFPLPLDLLNQLPEYDDLNDKDTFFRLILYWLEKLNRIKLGVYTPTYLPIKVFQDTLDFRHIISNKDRESLTLFQNFLFDYQNQKFPEAEIVMMDMAVLRVALELKSSTETYRLLFLAQKAKLIRVERDIRLQPTKLRTEELKKWVGSNNSPMLEAVFGFAQELLRLTRLGDQVDLHQDDIESIFNETIFKCFNPRNIFWQEIKNEKKNEPFTPNKIAEKLQKDFEDKRSKFAFKILSFLPKIRHKSILETDEHSKRAKISQLLYNGYNTQKIPAEEIESLKSDVYELIMYVSKKYIEKNITEFNIVDLINYLNLSDKPEEYFQNLVFIAKGLGYLKGNGSLIPMGIEMRVVNTDEIEGDTIGSFDNQVKKEFLESSKMKELRLLALECLAEKVKQSDYDQFIKSYFKCGSLSDLISLLEDYIGEQDQRFKAFRAEALENEKNRLNSSQMKVYSSDIRRNIQVLAGPGSGKTHTLTMRVARLIQEENVRPETILILAYNRSVVVELKDRLRTLFKDLGYSKLISQLKVFTFHGFIKYCISQQTENLEFKEWTSEFLNIMDTTPGLITQKLGPIKYVFVDEFQDITTERMQLLNAIANPNRVKVCVIGDPNQSIYGYERSDAGDSMNPMPFYVKFKEVYNPLERRLDTNYRSYPQILDTAERLLNLNTSKFDLPKLIANRQPVFEHSYCEVIDIANDDIHWTNKLIELINFEHEGNNYGQIAIMFRSNNEVFRAYNKLRSLNLGNIRIRIQGAKADLFKSREFYHLISKLEAKVNERLDDTFLNEIRLLISQIAIEFPVWDKYLLNVFHCLAIEFEKERDEQSTYLDFILFVKEISSKDDGQFGKIYQQNINQIVGANLDREIVLTTMHKVKGLEFDAVLIPPSFSNLPAFENSASFEETLEEERRLYYVAYTRAKYRLVVLRYGRELALYNGQPYNLPENQAHQLGVNVKEGLDKFKMYWSAGNYGGNSFDFIHNNVALGESLSLRKQTRGAYSFWHVYVQGNEVAQLSSNMSNYLGDIHTVNGFSVSSIYVHTYNETIASDEKNDTAYAKSWTEEARNRGYIYLLDFSGYGSIT
ncbi:UvrD-helicase domain-containing protein [Flagellimonas iocasae]|uniref:DNA 3'-5' helicase n=1 Tax=Flagellimonas iocasae TaxID=2055905 RepID=A0ABW4Y054_9FLAO